DPNSTPKLGDDHRLVRGGIELVMDQGDEYGVEEGLQLAEKTGGAVTVVSMGPEKANDAIRKALSMGAESGILITDPGLAGSDAPVVVTVAGGLNEPRYPTLKGIMGAKSKTVENVDLAALGLDASQVGDAGALVKVESVDPAPERQAGEVIADEGQSGERVAT